jgi:hypothetical protein
MLPKRPLTVEIIRWRMANSVWLWAGSIFQVVRVGADVVVAVAVLISPP